MAALASMACSCLWSAGSLGLPLDSESTSAVRFGQLYELSGAEISIDFFARGFILLIQFRGPSSLPVRSGALGQARNLARARKQELESAAARGGRLSLSLTDRSTPPLTPNAAHSQSLLKAFP